MNCLVAVARSQMWRFLKQSLDLENSTLMHKLHLARDRISELETELPAANRKGKRVLDLEEELRKERLEAEAKARRPLTGTSSKNNWTTSLPSSRIVRKSLSSPGHNWAISRATK